MFRPTTHGLAEIAEPADCDFDDFVMDEEITLPKMTEIMPKPEITPKPEPRHIAPPQKYQVSRIFYKKLFNTGKGVKCSPDHNTYYERNQSKKCKKYENPLFNDWQNDFCDKITEGHNVIAQVATSCGKTWAANLIISYYVLHTNKAALFITPNYEILRDNVSEILEKNHKIYLHPGSKIVDTQTRRFSSYVESGKTKAQILCITADNLVSFVTNDANHDFINKLQYIIFDEVHLPEIYNTIKWTGLLPTPDVQFILLSATITKENIAVFKHHLSRYSRNETAIISYDIRPIPLQFLHYKKDKTAKKRLIRQCSVLDPTPADIEKIIGIKLEESCSRKTCYEIGQKAVEDNLPIIIADIIKNIEKAELRPTTENLYHLLKYLFKQDMQPVIIFGMSAHSVKEMCSDMCKYINYLESIDEEHLELCKKQMQYQKIAEENKARAEKKKGDVACENPEDYEDFIPNMRLINRYKFPNLNEHTYFKPGFEKNMLEYGLGINISSTKTKTKNKIFDLFKTGKIKVLFADISISVGINLPIRTCIITDDSDVSCDSCTSSSSCISGNSPIINYSLFRQMSGRAGRRGYDTVGYVIPMIPKKTLISYLTMSDIIVPAININPKFDWVDVIKIITPETLSNYYHDEVESKKKPVLDLSKNSLKVSILRKKIMEKYVMTFGNEELDVIIKKVVDQGLHNNIFTNVINSCNDQAIIIIVKLILIDERLIKTDVDLIRLFATLICRKPGDDVLPAGQVLHADQVLLDDKLIELIESFDIIPDIKTPVSPWLLMWYTAKLTRAEAMKYSAEIDYICIIIYNLMKHIKAMLEEKQSHFKTILIETDRKYINMKKMLGMD